MENFVAHESETYEDLPLLPPAVKGRIVDGELRVNPGLASTHTLSASMLGGGTPLVRQLLHGTGRTSSERNR